MESKKLSEEIIKVLQDKKAQDIVRIKVSEKTIIADYFVIASGKSGTQVKALVENVEEKLEEAGVAVKRREGLSEGRWAVLDYGDVIVHVFFDECRLFYHLERLWGDEDNLEKFD